MADKALIPFRYGTRKRIAKVGTFPAIQTGPNVAPILLPKVGMLSAIYCVITGTIAFTGATVPTADGLAGLIRRLQVNANLGSASIVDVSGPGAELAAQWQKARGVPSTAPDYLTPTTGAVFYGLKQMIAANDGANFELGLINLQDPQIQVTVAPQFNPVTAAYVLGNTAGATVLQMDVWYEYFEIPDPTQFAMPPRALVRTLEDQLNGLVVGDNTYQVPRLGTILQQGMICYANSIRLTDDQLSLLRMRFNKTDTIEERNGYLQRLIDGQNYGLLEEYVPGTRLDRTAGDYAATLMPGGYTFDFWYANGVQSSGDLRDAVDSEELTTTEFIATYATGTTVVNTDIIRCVRRVVQILG